MSVQIPLWTIVTKLVAVRRAAHGRSDSSMDDCNSASRISFASFPGSDSSMDDCNGRLNLRIHRSGSFRFLYGRL